MYSVDYYNIEQFPLLRKEWEKLEIGDDMTVFQSYNWYEMLNKYYVPGNTKNYISIYATVRKSGKVVLIAPLWIVLHTFSIINKRGVYFLGRKGWSDYLNFIYDDFDREALSFLLSNITIKFKTNRFCLESLRHSSASYQYICKEMAPTILGNGICVSVLLPSSTKDYYNSLSKNTRQNIRTANNRLKKDGVNFCVVTDDQQVDTEKCFNIREERFLMKFDKISKLRKFKYAIMKRLSFQFKSFLPFYTYEYGHFLTSYCGDELSSFFYYLIDKSHKEIVVLAAGVNIKYSRYSPGILSLYDFIDKNITHGDISSIDFTSGNEKYKYYMGGKEKFISGLVFKL